MKKSIVSWRNSDNFTGVFYALFEGISKGGAHILLLFVATFISKELYVKILLLVSTEVLLTMFFITYYTDVLFSFKQNRSKQILNSLVEFSFLQYLCLIIAYFVFKRWIDHYFQYDLQYISIVIAANGFLSNLIRFHSVSYQLELNHRAAIFYKSIPFFSSFIFCIVFFILLKDKVLGFFLGKFIGLLLFYTITVFKHKSSKLSYSLKYIYFSSFLNRAKYSFFIAFIGWLGGLGFINLSNIILENKSQVVTLGFIFNMSSVLQLFSNGLNQVYAPKLKTINSESLIDGMSYSKKFHHKYFLIFGIVAFAFILLILFQKNNYFEYLNLANLFVNQYYVLIIPLVFLINSFQWVYSPYLILQNNYKSFLYIKIITSIFFWILAAILLFFFEYNNFILLYLLLQLIDSFGIYFYVKGILNKLLK